jgi:hypothetical protein
MIKKVLAVMACVSAVACGSGSPSAPSSSSSASSTVPSGFRALTQQVTMTNNVITFTWTGSTGSYKVSVGTAAGLSDVMTTTVSTTSYTWQAPRTANVYYARVANASGDTTNAQEVPVFTLDLRHVIDAMYFGGGPMSESPTVNPGNAPAAVFADGVPVTVIVTNEAAPTQMPVVQSFVADYKTATSDAFPINITTSSNDYKGADFNAIPENTVVVRVFGACTQVNVIACANYGPLPVGPNRSYVNMNAATSAASLAVGHEIGHSFGLHHVVATSAGRAEFAFLMNPALINPNGRLTEVEMNAIAAGRAGGIRANWTRNQALAAGLVLPFTGSTFARTFVTRLDDIIRAPDSIR